MCSIIIRKETIDKLIERAKNGQLEEFYKQNEQLIKDIDLELKKMVATSLIGETPYGYIFSNFLVYTAYLMNKQDDHLQNIPDELRFENNWEEFFMTHYNPFKLMCVAAKEDGCVDFNFEYWQQFVTPKKEHVSPKAFLSVLKLSLWAYLYRHVYEYLIGTGQMIKGSAIRMTELMLKHVQYVTIETTKIYNNRKTVSLKDQLSASGIFWAALVLIVFVVGTFLPKIPVMIREIYEFVKNSTKKRKVETTDEIEMLIEDLNNEKQTVPQIDNSGLERDVKAYEEKINGYVRESDMKSKAFDEKMKNEREELKKSLKECYKESLTEQEKADYHAEFEKKVKEQKDRFDEEMRSLEARRDEFVEMMTKEREDLEERRKAANINT